MSELESELQKLKRELEHKTKQVRILEEVSTEVNATLDFERILDSVLRTMDEVFGFRHSMLLLLDEGSEDKLRVVASSGYEGEGIGAEVEVGVGPIGMVAKKGRMMRLSNLRQQRAYAQTIRAQMQAAGATQELSEEIPLPGLPDAESQVIIPLRIREKLIGVFAVESPRLDFFDEGDELLVSLMANQAAAAINNARSYRAEELRREELKRLNETLEDRVQARTAELEHTNLELRETQAQLVQSAKMASLGQLVAGVAHELNTPMGSVSSSLQTIERAVTKLAALGLSDDPAVARVVRALTNAASVMSQGTERVNSIVRRLRSFARLDEAEKKRVDVHETINDTLAFIQHELPEGAVISTDYHKLPSIVCYPSRLSQLFSNLILNAAQAIDGDGGRIDIASRVVDESIEITLSDNGHGMSEDVLHRVFEPGFTTRGVGVGTGLGLSICYQIIQDHSGSIQIDSKPNKGTKVTVSLPISAS